MEREQIDAYVQGELTDEQAARFEEWFMDKPEIIEAIAIDRALQTGMRAAQVQTEREEQPRPPRRRLFDWLRLPDFDFGTRTAAAVSAVAVVSLGLALLQSVRVERLQVALTHLQQPQPNTASLVVRSYRSASQQIDYTVPEGATWVSVEVELDAVGHDAYVVDLTPRGSDASLIGLGGLRPTAVDTLAFLVPASMLRPGNYDLEIRPDAPATDAETVTRFSLHIAESSDVPQ